jgi:hypothetical protein
MSAEAGSRDIGKGHGKRSSLGEEVVTPAGQTQPIFRIHFNEQYVSSEGVQQKHFSSNVRRYLILLRKAVHEEMVTKDSV